MANRAKATGVIAGFVFVCFLAGCGGSDGGSADSGDKDRATIDPFEIEPSSIESFDTVGSEICREDGKPVIRMFSTTWCSHCIWVSDTFDAVVKMYADEGLLVAHHWEMDTGDDTLTDEVEQGVPDDEMAVYTEFNPQDTIPTFVFGCKYFRIGTGHEQEDDLEAEAAEFMAVIEALIAE